jgi:hypothetical protein
VGAVFWYFPDSSSIVLASTDASVPVAEDTIVTYNGVTFTWTKSSRTLEMDRPVRIITNAHSSAATYIDDILQLVVATTQTGVQSTNWADTSILPETPPYTSEIEDASSGTTGLIRKSDLKTAITNAIYTSAEQWANGGNGLPPGEDLPVGTRFVQTYLDGDDAVIVDSYPDEANRESINRIAVPASGSPSVYGSWTVDRDGYVWLSGVGTPASGQYAAIAFVVNGADRIQSVVTGARNRLIETLKVKKGDVVNITIYTGSGTISVCESSCLWEPALYKTVPTPNLQVEIGTDYSTTEQPVMVMDAVTQEIRQKLDVDGSPIWERTFVGTRPAAAAYTMSTIILATGIKHKLDAWGRWSYEDTNLADYPVEMFRVSSFLPAPTTSNTYRNSVIMSGGDLVWNVTSAVASAGGLAQYQITAQYTKL